MSSFSRKVFQSNILENLARKVQKINLYINIIKSINIYALLKQVLSSYYKKKIYKKMYLGKINKMYMGKIRAAYIILI